MNTQGRSGRQYRTDRVEEAGFMGFRLAPIARAIALTVAAGGAIGSGVNANAAQPFSAGWFGAMGVNQHVAAVTGYTPNGKPASAFNPGAQQQAANTQLQQSIANLTLAAHGIAMMQAQQASWRKAALGNPSTIPNGLGVGGLDTGSLASSWINAIAPTTQTTDANGNIVVDIQQTADKAIANWETFNVGKNTIVQFDQASADWAILNRITDPLLAPSTIQGQIRASGTVLIVNKNGIMFSGSSQINVRNLVAAAAEITDGQFTARGLYGVDQSTASFTNAQGNLMVEAGAQITTNTPGSVTQGGGYVLLMGQQVNNAGDIETPQGQAELAAGDNFIIRKGVGTNANTASTTRGNEISPQGNGGGTTGQVINTGLLLAREGDVTMAGHDVRQNGVAVATTTVNTRGTIHLLNAADDIDGRVSLGSGAATVVAIEDDGVKTALNSRRDALIADSAAQDKIRGLNVVGAFNNLSGLSDRRDQSRIEIVSGGNVDFAGDSLTLATGGQIAVSATGNTLVADRAKLDVSGAVGVNLAMASNNISINVQGNELRDAPLNRDSGALFNNNVWIDARNLTYVPAGTDGYASDRWYTAGGLLEVSGYLSNTGHGIGEWSAQGGTIQLGGGALTTEAGSQINLSGGSINVATGYIHQTWLKGSDGQLYSVDNAPADMTFTGVYKGFEVTHPRWGVDTTVSFYNPLIAPQKKLQNGYTIGRDAGELIILTPNALLRGNVVADVFNGAQQNGARPAGADDIDGYKLGQNQAALQGTIAVRTIDPGSGTALPLATDVYFSNDVPPDDVALQGIWFNADALNRFHLGGISMLVSGALKIDDALTLAPGGAFKLISGTTDINGDLTARGGSVLIGSDIGTANTGIVIEEGVTIDTRGLWTNAMLDNSDLSGLAYLNGGKVTLQSNGDVTLSKDTLIDASAGGAILSGGKTRGGAGGDIALIAGYAENNLGGGGDLTLDGKLRSLGFTRGGALTIQSSGKIMIGDMPLSADGVLPANLTTLQDLYLDQDLTVPAGTPIPIDYIYEAAVTVAAGGVAPITEEYRYFDTVTYSADWVMPADASNQPKYSVTDANGQAVPVGGIVQTGLPYGVFYIIPAGGTLPADLFPNGLSLPPLQLMAKAGTVFTDDVTIAMGSLIPAGSTFDQAVHAALPPHVLEIPAEFFTQGFSSYSLNGISQLNVVKDARIDVAMPVLQFNPAGGNVPTGADAESAASLVMPPLFMEGPLHAKLTQRAGADLLLLSGANADMPNLSGNGDLDIGQGAVIAVDPGREIKVASGGQITIDGTLSAPGGAIAVVNNRRADGANLLAPGALSIWIGSHAVLDASGRAYTASDNQGRTYGMVQDGGSIVLGSESEFSRESNGLTGGNSYLTTDAMIIIRPGALLDVSGTSAMIDLDAGRGAFSLSGNAASDQRRMLASDGGSIALRSYSGIYVDDALLADGTYARALRGQAGGAGASGGALSVVLEAPLYGVPSNLPGNGPAPGDPGRVLNITEETMPSGFAADLQPGQTDPALMDGVARIAARQIGDGGFDTVSLYGRSGIVFDGDVTLNTGRSISLFEGELFNRVAGGKVSLNAPYIFFGGRTTYTGGTSGIPVTPTVIPVFDNGGSLEANASLIDVQNDVSLQFDTVRFTSRGDIRFLASTDVPIGGFPTTLLTTPGDLSLVAQQLYPTTGALVTVMSGLIGHLQSNIEPDFNTSSVLTIGSVDGAVPAMPFSVFGSISFAAGAIEQGGIVRAPLGAITLGADFSLVTKTARVELLPGSLTSVSAAGLTMPYGGTVDGVQYTVNGGAAYAPNLVSGDFTDNVNQGETGIKLHGFSILADSGSHLDLSGGGTLLGAAFVSGRGGSVDTLLYPRNPGGQVFAIAPGIATAPVPGGYATAWTGAVPGPGQQITIPSGVPGLPAGTYALLPANYALLPGAYRVELGARTIDALANAVPLPDGSTLMTGVQSVAHTAFHDAENTLATITPGSVVRTYSQYNEQGYDAFQLAHAATFGTVRPLLPRDGKILAVNIDMPVVGSAPSTMESLVFNGSAAFAAAQGGYDGGLSLTAMSDQLFGLNGLVITAPGSAVLRTDSVTPVAAAAIAAINAPNLYIGGRPSVNLGTPYFQVWAGAFNFTSVEIEPGMILSGSQVMIASPLTLDANAQINTLGRGFAGLDSSLGYVFAVPLIVSNGQIVLVPQTTSTGTSITIGEGASLYAEGTIGFTAPFAISGTSHIGARTLAFAADAVNIGTDAVLANAATSGILPAGLSFNQTFLDQLLEGNPEVGAPAVENLVLGAASSINFYGSVDLNTIDPADGKSRLRTFALNSPAIYGYGTAGDAVHLAVDTLVWSGNSTVVTDPVTGQQSNVSASPGALLAGGPGSGSGTFSIDANRIILGYGDQSQPNNSIDFNRLILGFSTVNLNARESISANAKGNLAVYATGADPGLGYDFKTYAGSGGNLNLATPLLTGDAGSVMHYKTGGALAITAPPSSSSAAAPQALGAEIELSADSILVSSSIALPSGKLGMNAANDITLADGSRLDLSGRTIPFFDLQKYSWGGDIDLESAHGNIVQAAGSTIDLSAGNSDAGTLKLVAVDAGAGRVQLGGTLLGSGGEGHNGGSIDIRAQRIGADAANLSGDFAALNNALDSGGYFGARSFDLKQGDLVVGNEVKAQQVNISVDGGSLTVNGTIDAAGVTPGIIRLAARDDLTLAASAVLDAHGAVLRVDSYGQPIEAGNRGSVELTSLDGWLNLKPGATIDLSAPDGVARGRIELNAGRTGGALGNDDTAGDIRISAAGPLAIRGAGSIAANGFWRNYSPTDADGSIVQDNGGTSPVGADGSIGLNQIDQRSVAFINAALANGDLQGRLAGLAGYGPAFHLRPGVEINSKDTPTGNLTVKGDLDLSGFRYGPGADRNVASATYGAGEPLALVIRASGDLIVHGSINDGFAPPSDSPDTHSIVLAAGTLSADTALPENVTLAVGVSLGAGSVLPFDIALGGPQTLLSDVLVTSDMTLHPPFNPNIGFNAYIFGNFDEVQVISGEVDDPGYNGVIRAGNSFFGVLADGAVIRAGTILRAANPAIINSLNIVAPGTQVAANSTLPRSIILGIATTLPSDLLVTGNPIVAGGTTYGVGTTIPMGAVLASGTVIGAGNTLPFDAAIEATTWAAGTPMNFVGGYTLTSPLALSAGTVLAAGTTIPFDIFGAVSHGTTWAVAPMQAEGTMSSMIRLVAGADLSAADTRMLHAASALQGVGNISLNDAHVGRSGMPIFSVIRTGTGDLDILAGGNFSEDSLYGIYTAGSQTGGSDSAFNLPRPQLADPGAPGGTSVLGAGNALYEASLNPRASYYPDHGGDLLVSAQGDLTGNILSSTNNGIESYGVANWLWRQGGAELGQNAAWSINFGTYITINSVASVVGFTGFGALGGGNVTVAAGGDAGNLTPVTYDSAFNNVSTGLVVAVGATGRVTSVTSADGIVTGGTLVQTGGGDLTVKIGGRLNPGFDIQPFLDDLKGTFTDLRGSLRIDAGAIGGIALQYGIAERDDPRATDPYVAAMYSTAFGGPTVLPGDATVQLRTRGDLVLGGAGDPGQAILSSGGIVGFAGSLSADPSIAGRAFSWFTLWQPATSISLFSAGGNLTPITGFASDNESSMMTPSLSAVAASGSIYYTKVSGPLELAPSPIGQLELLARDSIYAGAGINLGAQALRIDMSGANADFNAIPNPFKPAFYIQDPNNPFGAPLAANTISVQGQQITSGLFAFERDTVTGNLHAGDMNPSRIYAVDGDIVNILFGEQSMTAQGADSYLQSIAAEAVQVRAGRDIVNFGGHATNGQFGAPVLPSLILNANETDVSMLSAGRDMLSSNFLVAGPGTLEGSAGRNLYQGDGNSITSIGALASGDTRPGASIAMLAGIGANGPDYTDLAALYLNPANLADPSLALAGQPGKVAKTYDAELLAWLAQGYGFSGDATTAPAYFQTLPPEQQHVFLRQVYYAELLAAGREYNDPDSRRFGSYLRGRDMIATLFPNADADGNPIARQGDITLFGGSGVRTLFGGDIQMLAPGGQIVVGVQGEVPPSTSGVVTQGSGDIQIYSKDSVLLGLSRIMTTFGGDILAWSAEGDINAGRGSKTTLVYTPPKLVYDDFGNVTLSPDVPSTGAGIATLNPLPEVPAGDVDLIAPLGTIDVGEAGIRVSGNINLAALQVVNAANIVVKGKSTGIPTLAAVNVGALTNAGAAASQAAMAAQDVVSRERNAARQALPSIFTVRVLSFGNEPPADSTDKAPKSSPSGLQSEAGQYDMSSMVQIVGLGRDVDPAQAGRLTDAERRSLAQPKR